MKDFSFKNTGVIILFIYCVLVLNTFYVGPYSIRVYATIGMFLYLCISINTFRSNRVIPISCVYIKLYLTFLFIFLVCLLVTGEIGGYPFFKRFFSRDLVCLTAFFAIYLKVNSHTQIKQIVFSLILLCLFDNIITVLQMIGNELGWAIGQYLSPVDEAMEMAENHSGELGFSIAPGIFGDVVHNAFTMASFSPLAFAYLNKQYKLGSLFSLFFALISLIAIFLTQQRAAFYLFILASVFYMFISVLKKPIYWFLLILIIAIVGSSVSDFFSDFDFGRLVSKDNDSRTSLWRYATAFISDNFLFGGVVKYTSVTGLTSHTLILDSFIFAGIGGFISLMIFEVKIGFLCARQVLLFLKNNSSHMTFALAIAMSICTLYGFTHNTSVLTGDVIVFILLALLLKSIKLDKLM